MLFHSDDIQKFQLETPLGSWYYHVANGYANWRLLFRVLGEFPVLCLLTRYILIIQEDHTCIKYYRLLGIKVSVKQWFKKKNGNNWRQISFFLVSVVSSPSKRKEQSFSIVGEAYFHLQLMSLGNTLFKQNIDNDTLYRLSGNRESVTCLPAPSIALYRLQHPWKHSSKNWGGGGTFNAHHMCQTLSQQKKRHISIKYISSSTCAINRHVWNVYTHFSVLSFSTSNVSEYYSCPWFFKEFPYNLRNRWSRTYLWNAMHVEHAFLMYFTKQNFLHSCD